MFKYLATATASALIATSAMAAYPEQPVRIVVGYSAGGTTDILARALAEQLTQEMGTPVVVDNKPGAAGSIGAAYVQNAKPDGYTLFVTTVSTHGITPALSKELNYDPVKGFSPVAVYATIPLVLVTNPKRGYKTVDDLVADIKANPDKLNYASSGNGGPVHLAGAMFASQADLDVTHIPYRGGNLANTSVMSGDTQFTFATMPAALPQVKGGTLDALAVTTKDRSTELPDVPALSESPNFPGYEISTWNALLAPANTPQDVIDTINKAVNKVMASDKLQTTFKAQGATPQSTTPAQAKAFVNDQLDHWAKTIPKLGIEAN